MSAAASRSPAWAAWGRRGSRWRRAATFAPRLPRRGHVRRSLGSRRSRARRPRGGGAFRVREQGDEAIEDRLAAHVRDADLLLVLDNCEHVREACGELVERPARAARAMRVLATSREALGVRRRGRSRCRRSGFPRRRQTNGAALLGGGALFLARARERAAAASRTTTGARNRGADLPRPGRPAARASSSRPRGRRRCPSTRSRSGSTTASASSSRGGVSPPPATGR